MNLHQQLAPGDMLLLAARPGQGKTRLALQLALDHLQTGQRAVFFTLEYTEAQVENLLSEPLRPPEDDRASVRGRGRGGGSLEIDCSDSISAATIMSRLAEAPRGTMAVIDYLQLLDQKRENPELADQVRALKSFAEERGLILVFISQVSRTYNGREKAFPDRSDIRLPNPLDLSLFNKTCFLNNGETQFKVAS